MQKQPTTELIAILAKMAQDATDKGELTEDGRFNTEMSLEMLMPTVCDCCKDDSKEAFPYCVEDAQGNYWDDLCNECFDALGCVCDPGDPFHDKTRERPPMAADSPRRSHVTTVRYVDHFAFTCDHCGASMPVELPVLGSKLARLRAKFEGRHGHSDVALRQRIEQAAVGQMIDISGLTSNYGTVKFEDAGKDLYTWLAHPKSQPWRNIWPPKDSQYIKVFKTLSGAKRNFLRFVNNAHR